MFIVNVDISTITGNSCRCYVFKTWLCKYNKLHALIYIDKHIFNRASEFFQDGEPSKDGGSFSVILNLSVAPLPPTKFCFNTIQEEMLFEESQSDCRSGHLGYGNITILAILNLHVAPLPPTQFLFNLTDYLRNVL